MAYNQFYGNIQFMGGAAFETFRLENLAADPTVDLFEGRQYFNTVSGLAMIYSGSTWRTNYLLTADIYAALAGDGTPSATNKFATSDWVNQQIGNAIAGRKWKGSIAVAADFPVAPADGDTWIIEDAVTDNDATKTNTGTSFNAGKIIVWDAETSEWIIAGDISNIPNATISNRGVVQVGTNIDVDANGVISVKDASETDKGIVQLATDGESVASKAVQSNDSRLQAVAHGYEYTQATTATTWTVTHNKNTTKLFGFAVYKDGETSPINPQSIALTDANTLTLTFNTAIAGKVIFGYLV